MSQNQEQKAKAFEAALNRHGFPLQYAVARSARELASFEFSNWFPIVPEFPVRVQGGDTRIDLILQHRRKPSYLVVETKRANPALAYWCFAKSGFRVEWALPVIYSEILRKVDGQFFGECGTELVLTPSMTWLLRRLQEKKGMNGGRAAEPSRTR